MILTFIILDSASESALATASITSHQSSSSIFQQSSVKIDWQKSMTMCYYLIVNISLSLFYWTQVSLGFYNQPLDCCWSPNSTNSYLWYFWWRTNILFANTQLSICWQTNIIFADTLSICWQTNILFVDTQISIC